MTKKTVILRGPVLTQSGYGVHCRQIARWLLTKDHIDVKFNILPWGETPWLINANNYDGLVGEIISRSVDANIRSDVAIQLQLPNEWNPNMGVKNIGVTAGVETDCCNPEWVKHCNAMDMIIVPSKHVANSFNTTGKIEKPLNIIPESFIDDIEKNGENLPSIPNFSTNFNFLVFGQLTGNNPYNDRKNTFFTIKWLCEAFKDDSQVGLVIKTNAGRNTKIDRNIVKNLFQNILAECRKGPYPKIHLLHGDMHDDEVAALYRHPQIKAMVSLTRGEGFGLPILEAARSALPIITTGWSGHMDFMKLGKFINVNYNLETIHASRVDDNIFMKNSRWANPVEDDFKKKIIKFRNSDTIPREWATELSKILSETHSFENICKKYDEVLKDII